MLGNVSYTLKLLHIILDIKLNTKIIYYIIIM
jgi:hypothetical protein